MITQRVYDNKVAANIAKPRTYDSKGIVVNASSGNSASEVIVKNNRVDGEGQGFSGIWVSNSSAKVTVENNEVMRIRNEDPSAAIHLLGASQVTVRNNLIHDTGLYDIILNGWAPGTNAVIKNNVMY